MNTTYNRIRQHTHFTPPSHWHRLRTIDMHAGGEPLRVVVGGFPALRGSNVLECRQYVREHHDNLRRVLMHEPRGHADMYGCLLVPPNDEGADFGILFLHNEGYSTMCGHATIAIARLAVEMGWVEKTEPQTTLRIDAPCGRLTACVAIEGGKAGAVSFDGVPSFVIAADQQVEIPGIGRIRYDLAYGGAFYAYVDARDAGIPLVSNYTRQLIKTGMDIKKIIAATDNRIRHPFEEDLSFLYGTIFTGDAQGDEMHSRHVCIFAEGELDRSPTGSGVMGRLALLRKRKQLSTGQTLRFESITGSTFTGSILKEAGYGPYTAVIPRVGGTAFITGQHEFLLDPEDPFQEGFLLRNT
jgi:proline racemase